MFKTLNVKTATVTMRVFVLMRIFFEENNKAYFYSWLSYVTYFILFWVNFLTDLSAHCYNAFLEGAG